MKRAPAINPNLVHRFYRDHTASELELIQRMLGFVPDHTPGAAKALYEKFKGNKATVLERFGPDGKIVSFGFFEINEALDGSRDFCLLGAVCASEESFLDADFKKFEEFARQLKCQSLSVATSRIGLVGALVERHGWFVGEIVLRKELR